MKTFIVVYFFTVFYAVKTIEIQPIAKHNESGPIKSSPNLESTSSIPILTGSKPKIEFPSEQTDDSTPIVVGSDPKKSNMPPKVFPSKENKESTGPSIVSADEVGTKEMNHSKEDLLNENPINVPLLKNAPKLDTEKNINSTILKSAIKSDSQGSKIKVDETAEQEDMLHSKYKGGVDVDEKWPEKKAIEVDEKKTTVVKKNPKSEVSVSPTLDKNGPKFMNDTKTKSGQSMLESTSKMMAVSSSVLANTQSKQQGSAGKTVVSVLLTAVALVCFGALGLLVWKRIAMRRFGRDVLINEDDFDEVADMHTFDRAQIQIT